MRLLIQAITKYLLGVVLVGLLLFIPAGSLNYYHGWLFMGILFIPMFIAGLIMFFKNPNLLKSRLDAKENQKEQKEVLIYSALMFILGFIMAGLNYRYEWLVLPDIVVIIAMVIFVMAYILYGEVLRENTYLLRTIKVEENQKLIDTGLYGVVRHPMYMVTIILFLAMPLVLGSLISFVIFLVYPFIIVKRIKNEEMVLEQELKGYKEYKKKVKYCLIPYIW